MTPVNDPPEGEDNNAAIDEDSQSIVTVLTDRRDRDRDLLTVASASAPEHGAVAINPDFTITYVPVANFCGADGFDYTIADGNGGTDMAQVSVVVRCLNDAPPLVRDDTAYTDEDTGVTIPVPDKRRGHGRRRAGRVYCCVAGAWRISDRCGRARHLHAGHRL